MKDYESAYWLDALDKFYIEREFGRFDDAVEAFEKANPDFAEYATNAGRARVLVECAKKLARQYREIDHHEHEDPPPTPPHLRDTFLPFHIDVPPMAPSVSAFNAQGRVGGQDASPKQHRDHHRRYKNVGRRMAEYHETSEERWNGFIGEIRTLLTSVDRPDDRRLRDLAALVAELQLAVK